MFLYVRFLFTCLTLIVELFFLFLLLQAIFESNKIVLHNYAESELEADPKFISVQTWLRSDALDNMLQ
jgi:multisubunit Na+/H+ antiporter MnhE subunit